MPQAARPSKISLRRQSYSFFISSTSASPFASASTAANWLVVGAHIMPYWWILNICAVSSDGASR